MWILCVASIDAQQHISRGSKIYINNSHSYYSFLQMNRLVLFTFYGPTSTVCVPSTDAVAVIIALLLCVIVSHSLIFRSSILGPWGTENKWPNHRMSDKLKKFHPHAWFADLGSHLALVFMYCRHKPALPWVKCFVLVDPYINIVQVVKSRRMRWAGHVAGMGRGERCAQGSGGETWAKETIGETQT